MEKFSPSYSLSEFKASNFAITRTAIRTAQELGLLRGRYTQNRVDNGAETFL